MAAVETLNGARSKLARFAARLSARAGGSVPPLVLMTDDTRKADWMEAAGALPAGSAVVVRHRDACEREVLARRLRPVCARRRIALLIAGDAALAMRVRADGVHLPEAHVAKLAAVRRLHRGWLVTAAAHDAAAVIRAARLGADAIFVSPVFATASHPERAALGAVRFAALTAATWTKVYALGGIDARSSVRLGRIPIAGVALIGGWVAR
jgi:thiamine-phosphate pyrophosphorylase